MIHSTQPFFMHARKGMLGKASRAAHRCSKSSSPLLQRGVVMLLALVFLLLLTILAISATGNALLQERMAGGLRNAQQARMSADTALRAAEWRLWSSSASTASHIQCRHAAPAACYVFDVDNPIEEVIDFRTKPGWVTAGATTYSGSMENADFTTLANGKLARNPVYMIEDMGTDVPVGVHGSLHESGATGSGSSENTASHIYRITARGSGGNDATVRVVESTFSAKVN